MFKTFLLSLVTLVSSWVNPVASSVAEGEGRVLATTTDTSEQPVLFTVNIPARFTKDLTAPNILYSLTGGVGVRVSNTDTQNPILSLNLVAGDGITVDGNKITNTYTAPAIDYTLGGWTDNGTSITLTTTTDTVTMDTVTAGDITADSLTTSGLALAGGLTVTSGNSILPDTDLGSDLGSSSKRFNNL